MIERINCLLKISHGLAWDQVIVDLGLRPLRG
jgi:hypothetical protein